MPPRAEDTISSPSAAATSDISSNDNDNDVEHVHVPVLIVGAGPTGLLLAGQLARRSIRPVHLIDRNPAPLEWDRATVINTATLEVMDALGLADQFCSEGVHIRGVKMHSGGETIGTYRFEENESRFGHGLGLSEERTEHFLTEYLEAQGGTVRWSSKLLDLEVLEADKGGVLATIERSTVDAEGSGEVVASHTYQVRADYVVGCDGIRSKTREMAGIQYEGHVIEQPWAVFDTTLDGWEEAGNTYEANHCYLSPLTPVILTPLPGKKWRVYMRPMDDESDLAEEASDVLRQYEPGVSFVDAQNFAHFRCVSKVADTYRSGRILVAGDAAHACTPAEGHGMNYGLQDSYNLAWKLALVVKGSADPVLLDSYHEERRPFAEMILKSGEHSEKVTTMKCPQQRAARDKMLRSVFASVLGTRKKASVMSKTELNVEYGASSIVSGRSSFKHPDAPGPGARMPNTHTVRLGPDDGWKSTPLHELAFCCGHTVLLLGGPDADGPNFVKLYKEVSDLVASEADVFEAAFSFATDPSITSLDGKIGLLESSTVDAFGVDGIAMLVVRPDGFIGLREGDADGEAEKAFPEMLSKYSRKILRGE